jgi:hypothetical protein
LPTQQELIASRALTPPRRQRRFNLQHQSSTGFSLTAVVALINQNAEPISTTVEFKDGLFTFGRVST